MRVDIVAIVVVAAIGVRVVEVGATCGSPGHHGIEARRRALVDHFSSAPWVHDPPVIIFSARGATCPDLLVS